MYNKVMEYLPLEEKKYWLAYSQIGTIDWPIIRLLVKTFGSLERSWARTDRLHNLELYPSAKVSLRHLWLRYKPERILEVIERSGVKAVAIVEKRFPQLLREIHDPPFLLYYRGQLPREKELCLASVGTRRASGYGQSVTRHLIEPVANRGVVVVSGLAYGIDQTSHQAALSAKGRTIAVLGAGVDDRSIYPASNYSLAQRIVKSGGALISEYPNGVGPKKHFFVARNRIIAGLSKATLVVEAPKKSGALITAEFALEEGREVLAVPGNIGQTNSQGTNRLIREGATPVLKARDILELLDA